MFKERNIKKNFVASALAFTMIFGTAVTALAAESNLEYKGAKAKASLETTFQWKLLGNDKATAKTKFTKAKNNYRVAVRLERWDSKNTRGDYKYDSDSSLAQCNYTWTDVYSYQSRHSIDNSTDTKELSVDSFNEVE